MPLTPRACAAGNERLKGSPSDFREMPSLIRAIGVLAWLDRRFVAEKAKRPSDLLERPLVQADGAPLGTSYVHILTIIIQGDRAEQIHLVLAAPNIRRVRERHARQHAIHEDEQRQIVGAEQPLPVRQPVDVFLRRPALPDVARLAGRPAGKLPPLDIDEQLGAAGAQDDEVEVFDGHIAQHRPPRFIDGDVAEALLAQERLERRFVGIAAIHRNLISSTPPLNHCAEVLGVTSSARIR